jgi:5-azacytidine-induced protein 1
VYFIFKALVFRFADKIQGLEEGHSQAIKKLKSTLVTGEKTKRENWLAEKTKEIREMTIKGLEPEIQKLITVRLTQRIN